VKLSALGASELRKRSAGTGLGFRTGPFSVRLRSAIPSVLEGLSQLYGEFELEESAFADFHVDLDRPRGLRRWLRPQVDFWFDGIRPFKPLPLDQAFPLLEWGLNWCVSSHAHHFLIIHAAVVEKNGLAAILPAPPGSGKSTLCAGLVLSGWRLLSDELTLIDPNTGLIHALARPVSLKNQSIPLIQAFSKEAFINRPSHDTVKGTVAHLRPPAQSVARQHEPARPGWVIFPKWQADVEARLTPRSRAQTFIYLAQNAFNYSHLGERAFHAGTHLIRQCECFDFGYHALPEAIRMFDALAAARRGPA
jgi:hypothetical protein